MSFEVKSYEQLVNFVEHRLFILVMWLANEGIFEDVVLDKLEHVVHVGTIAIERDRKGSDNVNFVHEDIFNYENFDFIHVEFNACVRR